MGVAGRVKNGELLLTGDIKQRIPMVQSGLVAHYPLDGTVRGTKATKNLVSMDVWQLDTSGAQGYFWPNGTAAENQIVSYANPFGVTTPVWATLGNDATSNDDGGWIASDRPIDNTKKYRMSVWIRRENVGNGTTYFGCQGNTVHSLSGAVNGNPYFLAGSFPETYDNWVLFVGYIQPHTYATTLNDPTNGLYASSGVRIGGAEDFKWAPTATVGGIRSYLYYSTAITERQYWWDPRIEVCDGTEASVAELLAGRNETIMPSNTSNCTVSYEGLRVEESTVNCFLDNNDGEPSQVWGRDTADVTITNSQAIPALFGEYVAKWSKSAKTGTGNCYINGARFKANTSLVWTFSCYVRRADQKPVTSVGGIYLYGSAEGSATVTATITNEGNGWYRVSGTRTFTVPVTGSLVGFSSLDGTTDWYFDGWQMEPKAFATSYVLGSRGEGRFDIPFTLKPPYTINIWHKGIRPLVQVADQPTSPMIFQLGNYYGNASVSFWNYVKNLSIYIKGNTLGGWTSTFQPYSFNDAKWNNKENMYTLVAVDNRTFKAYVNGVFVGQGTSSEDVTNITYLSMGNTSMPNAQYRGLSLYDRAVTNEEAQRLYGQPYDVTAKGNLIVKDFVEKPNGIPIDAIHIPLDINGKDRMSMLMPSSEFDVTYDNGSVFVGSAPMADLEYNLNRDYGLDWNGDWTIVYWKKPSGTSSGPASLTGYNLESLGSNGNTIGGGYLWFGKPSGGNTMGINGAGTAFAPADYFGNWQMVVLSKTGTTIRYRVFAKKLALADSSAVVGVIAANRFVTQHGYDFKFGWDSANSCNSFYKDMVIAKRTLTDEEINTMYQTEMRAYPDRLQIQSGIKTNQIIT
jgi:hypothetical protein